MKIEGTRPTIRCGHTEAIWHRRRSRKLDLSLQRAAWRKLAMLDAAETLADLAVPPGNRLEKLAGDRTGQHSIRRSSGRRKLAVSLTDRLSVSRGFDVVERLVEQARDLACGWYWSAGPSAGSTASSSPPRTGRDRRRMSARAGPRWMAAGTRHRRSGRGNTAGHAGAAGRALMGLTSQAERAARRQSGFPGLTLLSFRIRSYPVCKPVLCVG